MNTTFKKLSLLVPLFILGLAPAVLFASPINMMVGTTYHYNDQHSGRNGWPANGRYSDSDSQMGAWCADGQTYLSMADGIGPNAVLSGGRNVFLTTLSSSVSIPGSGIVETMVNSMDSLGTITQDVYSNHTSIKNGGLDCQDGIMYLTIYQQFFNAPGHADFTGGRISILKSLDNGATWCSSAHTSHVDGHCTVTPSATGDLPGANEMMFDDSSGVMSIMPLQYCQDGSMNCPVADGNDVYKYGIAHDSYFDGHLYVWRVPLARYPMLDPTDYQWFKGGTWTDNANWGTVAEKGNLEPNTDLVRTIFSVMYIPQLQRYVMAFQNDPYENVFAQAPTPGGPWTALANVPLDPVTVQAWYTPILSSMTVTGSRVRVNYVTGANYLHRTSDPETNQYSSHFNTMTFNLIMQSGLGGSAGLRGSAKIR